MQVKVSTRHGHISEATREKLEAKLERLTKYFERLTSIELVVDLEDKARPTIDINVSAEHKHDFTASETADELFAAADGALHKIEQQLRKYKERVQDHHHR